MPAAKQLQLAPRCHAFSKTTGKRCGQPAIRGGTVCMVHGGASPAAKEAAMRRLATLVDPSIEVLYELLTNKKVSAATRLATAKDILDRTGFKPVDKTQEIPWDGDLASLPDAAMDRLTFLLERVAYGEDRARAEAARRKALLEAGAVVDVEPEPQAEESKEDGGEW